MLDRSAPVAQEAALSYGGGLPSERFRPLDQSYRALPYGGVEDIEEGFSPLRLLIYVVQYRWLIASLLLVGLVSGFLFYLMQTPIYQAATKLEISAPAARVVQDLEVVSETSDLRAFQTAIEKLKSRSVIRRAVFDLDLANNSKFLFPQPSFALSNLVNRVLSRTVVTSLDAYQPEERERMATDRIQANLNVALIRNTSILSVTFNDADPELARVVVNQIADSYIDQRVDQTSQTSDIARKFIQDQVLEVKKKLQDSEERLVAYAKAQGIAATGEDGSLVAQNIKAINSSLSEAISERLAAESVVKQIANGGGQGLKEVQTNQAVLDTRSKIIALKADYQQKLGTFKPEFPEMRMLKAQIDEYQKQLGDLSAAVVASVRQRLDEAKAKESQLKDKLSELETAQAAYEDKNIQYTILKREVDSNRSQYESLIGKLNDAGVGAELKSQAASVLDYALTPRSAVSPRLSRNLLVSLILAGGLAAIIVYLLELLNNTFRVPEQIEQELHLPVLSILPFTDPDAIDGDLGEQKSAISEAYRSLRTSLQFAGVNGTPKILLITSAQPGEGKTTTAHQVARNFSALGQRILLVDSDLRRPSIHRRLGLANTSGLSNILTQTVAKNAIAQLFQSVEPNLTVLTAGPMTPNPADLLSSQRMGMLFDAFQKRFDMIVIDGPPVIGLSDAPILSRLADATLMVISARQVTRKSAALALKRIRAAGGNVLGAALSKFRVGDFDYNYAYSYMKYDYYAYGEEPSGLLADGSVAGDRRGAGRPVQSWSRAAVADRWRRMLRGAIGRVRNA